MDEAARAAAELAIVANIEAWLAGPDQPGGVLGVYWAIRGEPQLLPACRRWLEAGRELALPRVTADDAPLAFGRWRPDAPMRVGRFKVPEPLDFQELVPDCLLVPCLGFDSRGFRLGYGGGFYDRTLARLGAIPTLGVAFESARVIDFSAEPHDLPLGAIATDAGLLRPP